ncbi:substrate-binding periplasmic protein [Vibrio sp. HN007]|uniref:substrate-binding periplasmic protein n=1 Tax=Vibrio iocasae TaxID=3098914 RepID=UPI0035D48392
MNVSSAGAENATLSNLQFYTEEYPPYNFSEGEQVRGIAVDLLMELAKQMNSGISRDSIHVWPWARSYRTVRDRQGTVLFSTARIPLRENLFQWAGPIAPTRIVLLGKKRKRITISEKEQLNKYFFGAIIDDVGEQLILDAGVPENQIETAYSPVALAQMLEHERIDLWAYEERVALWAIQNAGYQASDYEVVYVLDTVDMYYAFNNEVPKETVQAFQKALDSIKQRKGEDLNSVYDTIIKKYQY